MEEIFRKYQGNGVNCWEGTDKGSAHSYVEIYEQEFAPFREAPIRMLEIGICSGASLLAWGEYFTHPDANIKGIDVNLSFMKYGIHDPRITTLCLDGTRSETAATLGGTFDIVIDDGSHLPQDQATALELFGPRIRNGGIYVIEDVLDIRNCDPLVQIGASVGLTGTVHDRRHVKGDPYDIMIVFHKN